MLREVNQRIHQQQAGDTDKYEFNHFRTHDAISYLLSARRGSKCTFRLIQIALDSLKK